MVVDVNSTIGVALPGRKKNVLIHEEIKTKKDEVNSLKVSSRSENELKVLCPLLGDLYLPTAALSGSQSSSAG